MTDCPCTRRCHTGPNPCSTACFSHHVRILDDELIEAAIARFDFARARRLLAALPGGERFRHLDEGGLAARLREGLALLLDGRREGERRHASLGCFHLILDGAGVWVLIAALETRVNDALVRTD